MKDLDKWVDLLDYLDHDYAPNRDDAMVVALIKNLGEHFPVSVLDQVKKFYYSKALEIESVTIPSMLLEYGLSEAKTEAGLGVKVKTEYAVKTSNPDRMALWVESNGGESLYKRSLKFSKGEDISDVVEHLRSEGISYEESLDIHPQTLKKFVKDFIEENGSFPPEDAGTVTMYNHAVITRSK
jgi:hypothetical protein